jgi:hypothetical protein
MKRILYLTIFISVLSSGKIYTQDQYYTFRGVIHDDLGSFCMDACSHFGLEPDSGYEFTWLVGDLKEYAHQHVEVTGYFTFCVECWGLVVMKITVLPTVNVGGDNTELPSSIAIYQNYPNPFNPTTTISYDIPENSHVKLSVYDIMGREVANLVNEYKKVGRYEVEWDATDFPSGVYFYKLVAGSSNPLRINNQILIGKMALIK